MDNIEYDETGVTLSLDNRGRWVAKQIFVKGSKIVKSEILTTGRAAASATQEAIWVLERVSKNYMRGLLELKQPDPPKFVITEDK